jgi:hypothetical protein
MGKRNEPGILFQQGPVDIQIEQSIFGYRNKLEPDSLLLGEHVPGHQVRMVLHLGQNDQIPQL